MMPSKGLRQNFERGPYSTAGNREPILLIARPIKKRYVGAGIEEPDA